jgi:hypothetical protein
MFFGSESGSKKNTFTKNMMNTRLLCSDGGAKHKRNDNGGVMDTDMHVEEREREREVSRHANVEREMNKHTHTHTHRHTLTRSPTHSHQETTTKYGFHDTSPGRWLAQHKEQHT